VSPRAWLVGLACLGVACTTTSDPVVPGSDGGADPSPPPTGPAMQELGPQIDRVGRAGINSMLVRTWDPGARDEARDLYNSLSPKDARPMVGDFVEALQLWDGVDRNCGNQLMSTPAEIEGRYESLASRFIDDVLYVDSRSTDCWYYLGVETDEQGTVPNNDCGGRTVTEDVMDITYAILTNGMRGPMRDGGARDDRVHSNETFPFVAAADSSAPAGPLGPPPDDVAFVASHRSCKNLGYTDSVGGGGSGAFGTPCGTSDHCAGETALCVQNTCFYGGWCTEPCFEGDDSTCAHLGANAGCEWVGGQHACVTKCASDAECGRSGYHCGPEGYCISQDF
jgi:hypothetical protein